MPYDLGELGPAAAISGGLQGLLEAYKMKLGQQTEQAKMRQAGYDRAEGRAFQERRLKQDYDLGTMRIGETRSHNRAMETLRAAQQAKTPATKSIGQEAIDREFGKEYGQFVAGGGYADVQKQISQLAPTLEYLESPEGAGASGPVVGSIPDTLRAFTKKGQKAISARESVEEVAQRNLRLILGGQFAQKEGEKLIARAYNPKLSPSENVKRVRLMMSQIDESARAKMAAGEYMEKHGTLRGFPGVLRSSAKDFLTDADLSGLSGGGESRPLVTRKLKSGQTVQGYLNPDGSLDTE